MAGFYCDNNDCSFQGKEIIIEKIRWIWSDKQNKLIAEHTPKCPKCGKELVFIENKTIPNLEINKFDSLSTEEKRKIIQKRSSDHMRKTGESKDIMERKRQIISDNKQMVTGRKN